MPAAQGGADAGLCVPPPHWNVSPPLLLLLLLLLCLEKCGEEKQRWGGRGGGMRRFLYYFHCFVFSSFSQRTCFAVCEAGQTMKSVFFFLVYLIPLCSLSDRILKFFFFLHLKYSHTHYFVAQYSSEKADKALNCICWSNNKTWLTPDIQRHRPNRQGTNNTDAQRGPASLL